MSSKMFYDESVAKNTRVLLVGAGGIGCELLKNLVLSGFQHITIIDLDTIDISNLNRQFLFRKEHVGKSKAQVARESALSFNPGVDVVAHHDSIMSSSYGVPFFKQFDLVLNALDNKGARSHVNKMCLAADIPLIESGTAGYLGQVTLIKKKVTGCYDCQPKPTQKTYAGCTIRNTPSELIHCIVWAKHLFNQLFGEPDEDVSPDASDPEAAGDAEKIAVQVQDEAAGALKIKSTRLWAEEGNYNSHDLFNKFFNDDIKYLLLMSNLWEKRTPPKPLDLQNIPEYDPITSANDENMLNEQKLWSLKECAEHFHASVKSLREELQVAGPGGVLVWDKDSEPAMNFVTSAANIRAHIFHIERKSKFNIKSMAGNIIPAIATTNAIAAGLIVLEAFKVLTGRVDLCKAVFINKQPNSRKKLLVPCLLDPINPKCCICSDKREVTLVVNLETFTVKSLKDKVLKGGLAMVAPDVEIDDGRGFILISSEEGETDENLDKLLSKFGIVSGSRLKCDDFLQEYDIVINILHQQELPDEKEFEIVGDVGELQKDVDKTTIGDVGATRIQENGDANEAEDSGDEVEVISMDVEVSSVVAPKSTKRKRLEDDEEVEVTPPKRRNVGADDAVAVVD